MIKWKPFIFDGVEYDLTHLHPFEIEFKLESTQSKPEKIYFFEVCFSLHCFTYENLDDVDKEQLYSDTRETRVFCFERYELSKKLPEIIKNIFEKNCYHTGYRNYLIIEFLNHSGNKINYEVYFAVTKSSKRKNLLNLYVQSAYLRTKRPPVKGKKPIRFRVIAHNTLSGKTIKMPQ